MEGRTLTFWLLINVIDGLEGADDSLPRSLCIYAEGGANASPNSPAVVCPGDEQGGFDCPRDPALSYVLMVQQAKECVGVWSEWRGGQRPTPQDKLAAVMYYSRNDA